MYYYLYYHLFLEELFGLESDELGSLKDKDKPEAKVSSTDCQHVTHLSN